MREIQAFLEDMYAVEVSPDLISTVTEAVMTEVVAVYLALAVLPDGTRDILGVWIEQTEGAKFWMKVFADLQSRGCREILIAVTDGLKGMPDALEAIYPATTLQTCIVHLLRHSLDVATWKTRQPLAAVGQLDAFAAGPWGQRSPTMVAAWRRAWPQVIPFFAFPPDIRRVIDTTNALENVNRQLRKTLKTRGHFPTDEAATTLIWLALRNITATWKLPTRTWTGHEPIRNSL